MTHKEKCMEIVTQLLQSNQHGRLKAMLGTTRVLLGSENENNISVTIDFKGCRKANNVNIKLNGLDLYDITFYKKGNKMDKDLGIKLPYCNTVKEYNDIYNDQLKEIFESYSGLYLSLF